MDSWPMIETCVLRQQGPVPDFNHMEAGLIGAGEQYVGFSSSLAVVQHEGEFVPLNSQQDEQRIWQRGDLNDQTLPLIESPTQYNDLYEG